MTKEEMVSLLDAEPESPEIVEDESTLPDQDDVDHFGEVVGITYDDSEELRLVEKELQRDAHRWELDPASSEDYLDRSKLKR